MDGRRSARTACWRGGWSNQACGWSRLTCSTRSLTESPGTATGRRPLARWTITHREVLPTFDRAFTALIDDLERSGRLETTLVVAAGEFGRTPRLNASGGRDHWPGVWSVVLAGGGVRGGQVVGASDAHAGAPADRPVTPSDLLATMYHRLGIDPQPVTNPARRHVVSARPGWGRDSRVVRLVRRMKTTLSTAFCDLNAGTLPPLFQLVTRWHPWRRGVRQPYSRQAPWPASWGSRRDWSRR